MTDIYPQCNQPETLPTCTSLSPCNLTSSVYPLHGHLEESYIATDIRCVIVQGSQNWLLIGETNDSANVLMVQISYFQVPKVHTTDI
jgi:hypothetical protein